MLSKLASLLVPYFGPARLLQSNAVLICLALYSGFVVTRGLLPRFYKFLPSDRGREFTISAEAAKGKPTGAGVVFISFFVLVCIVFAPLSLVQGCIVALTWITMLTGYLDDRSLHGWGEYRKALLDLAVCLAASFVLYYLNPPNADGVYFWFPFVTGTVKIPVAVFIIVSTVVLWASINTTNCTDGVDGLSSTLVLIGLGMMGVIFYIVLGHRDIAEYLLVPHLSNGASWAIIIFALFGVLMGYLWHNAFPSKVLMGDRKPRTGIFYWLHGSGKRKPVPDSCNIVNYSGKRRYGLAESFPSAFFQDKNLCKYPFSAARPHAQKPQLVADTGTYKVYDYAAFNFCRHFRANVQSALAE